MFLSNIFPFFHRGPAPTAQTMAERASEFAAELNRRLAEAEQGLDEARAARAKAEAAKVTETYDIPPEALEEILILDEIFMATPEDQESLSKWRLWAAISRAVPAVAADPNGWELYERNPLSYYVERTI